MSIDPNRILLGYRIVSADKNETVMDEYSYYAVFSEKLAVQWIDHFAKATTKWKLKPYYKGEFEKDGYHPEFIKYL